jgi:hypothetical protein
MIASTPYSLAATALGLLLPIALHAGTTATEPPPAKQPPAEAAPASSLWEVTVTPYGWLASIDGDFAARGYTASTHVGIDEILDHLDMVAMLNVEARRGRWGGWIDGIYLSMSSDAETPGPLLDSLGIGSKTLMLEGALFYRLWEGPRGFVDLYAGVRYNRAETDLSFHPSDSGIRQVAADLSERVVDAVAAEVRRTADAALSRAKAAAAESARTALQSAVTQEPTRADRTPLAQLHRIAAAEPRVESSLLRDRALRRAIDDLAAARVNAAAAGVAAAEATVQQTKARAQSRAEQAVATAEKRLTRTIEKSLRDAIPDEISQTGDWVDPFVGLRGRYNFNDRLYAAAKADIGGFGVGSELTWQAYGGLGWIINHRWSTEIGYRHMAIDYGSTSGFHYDVDLSGVVVSASLRF